MIVKAAIGVMLAFMSGWTFATFSGEVVEILKEERPLPPTPPLKESEAEHFPFENKTRATCSTREDLMSIRNAISDPSHRWTKFYVHPDRSFNKYELQVINDAMYNLMRVLPCVSFGIWPPHSHPSGDYVQIIKGTNNGCDSYIGKQGGRQEMNLESPGCMHIGTVMHEFIHALGFFHEQARPDRDDHVDIFYENVIPGQRHNFHKFEMSEVSTLGIPYNVKSIMHYESDAWSTNGKSTILTKNGDVIGKNLHMQPTDIQKLRAMYKCNNPRSNIAA
ncbi:Zinc metalloproteinase nas-14, partial [Orchesella cincta]